MKTGHLSKQLGVSSQSIRRWTERFGEFLSDESRRHKSYQATYTDEDLVVFATIHYLSQQNIGLDEIEERLKSGYRVNENTVSHIYTPHTLASVEQVELQKVTFERDYALDKNRILEQQVENLTREIIELKYQLGITTGELNSLRRQTEQGR